jgi:hypothetical protein
MPWMKFKIVLVYKIPSISKSKDARHFIWRGGKQDPVMRNAKMGMFYRNSCRISVVKAD